jgi:oligopeptidase B
VDIKGDETHTIFILNLKTRDHLVDRIELAYHGLEWSNDSERIYYTRLNSLLRPYRLYCHTVNQPVHSDQLIYEETDEAYYLGLGKTRSKAYITVCLRNQVSTEYRYLSADAFFQPLKIFQNRRPNIEYYIEHQPATPVDRFYIMTNDGAKNFQIMKVDSKDTSCQHWEKFIPGSEETTIDDFELFKNHLVVYDRTNGLPSVAIHQLKTGDTHRIPFPDSVYSVVSGGNPNYDAATLRYNYSSLAVPETIFDYDMKFGTQVVVKETEILGGFDKTNYRTERLFANADDGTRIPISLVYRKEFKRDGRCPLILRGYGAYGMNSLPDFSSARVSFLDRGIAFAIAHVRGGGTLGRSWYEAGKLLNKKNTFSDFIAGASFLIDQKYTSADRLVATGGSAGGLLVGAVANMRPDLFKVILAQVPFVDVTHTMMDPSLPLTVIEYDEWGNPNDKPYFDYIRSYSPYDNVTKRSYPHILVTAGLNDPRVSYWEPAKWVARLRELKTDDNILLLKTEMEAGHFSVSGRYERFKDIAFEYAFILKGLEVPRGY